MALQASAWIDARQALNSLALFFLSGNVPCWFTFLVRTDLAIRIFLITLSFSLFTYLPAVHNASCGTFREVFNVALYFAFRMERGA